LGGGMGACVVLECAGRCASGVVGEELNAHGRAMRMKASAQHGTLSAAAATSAVNPPCCTCRLAWLQHRQQWPQPLTTRSCRLSCRGCRQRLSCGVLCHAMMTHASQRRWRVMQREWRCVCVKRVCEENVCVGGRGKGGGRWQGTATACFILRKCACI
jgi:hypothetical protein